MGHSRSGEVQVHCICLLPRSRGWEQHSFDPAFVGRLYFVQQCRSMYAPWEGTCRHCSGMDCPLLQGRRDEDFHDLMCCHICRLWVFWWCSDRKWHLWLGGKEFEVGWDECWSWEWIFLAFLLVRDNPVVISGPKMKGLIALQTTDIMLKTKDLGLVRC